MEFLVVYGRFREFSETLVNVLRVAHNQRPKCVAEMRATEI